MESDDNLRGCSWKIKVIKVLKYTRKKGVSQIFVAILIYLFDLLSGHY